MTGEAWERVAAGLRFLNQIEPLAFIRDNAAIIAIVAVVLALVFAGEVRRAHRRMPFFRAAPGSTHDDPSRDARRGGVSNVDHTLSIRSSSERNHV